MLRIILVLSLLLSSAQDPALIVIAKGALQPSLVADKDGGFYCAFIRGGNIELATSADNGKTWSAPVVAIDAKGRAKGGMQRGPRVGVDDKKVVTITAPLCFDEKELAKKYPTAELWLARSTDGGKSFSQPIQVNEQNGTAPEALHAMAVAPDGSAHVAWLDMRGREDGQDLYYAKVVDGKPGKNVKIASTVCTCCAPGIAIDVKGHPHIVWRDGSTSDDRKILRSSGPYFVEPTQINTRPTSLGSCPMDAPAVVANKNFTALYVAWMDLRSGANDRQVYFKLEALVAMSSRGLDERALADDPKGIKGHPTLGISEGEMHAAWEDSRSGVQRIYYRTALIEKDVPLSPEKGKASFPSLACGKVVGVAFEYGTDVVFASPRP